MAKITVCANCKHHFIGEIGMVRNHYCRVAPVETMVDPVTGRLYHINERGEKIRSRRARCEDVNKGNCELFEPLNPRRSLWQQLRDALLH